MQSRYPAEWISTTEVEVGDRLVCLLADADAYPEVTGWTDRELAAAGVVHRVFTVRGDVPWWIDEGQTTNGLAGTTLIVSRHSD